MPAEPYSLGIGVHVDEGQLDKTMAALSVGLATFGDAAAKVNSQVTQAFDQMRARAESVSKSMGAVQDAVGQPVGAVPTARPVDLNFDTDTGKGTSVVGKLVTSLSDELAATSGELERAHAMLDRFGASTDKVGDNTKAATKDLKGLDGELQKKPADAKAATTSFHEMGRALSYVTNLVVDFTDSLKDGFGLTGEAEALELETIRMAVGMGGAWKEANTLRDGILDLGIATGQSVEGITKLSKGLSNAGMSLADFQGAGTQAGLIGLAHNFGLTGEQIALTSKTVGNFGGSLDQSLDDATAFQKGFKVPGIFEQLPGVVNFARKTMLSFSDKVVSSGPGIVKATMNMGGAFSKAFGVTLAEGLKRGEAAMTKFASAAQQDEDVFLGLSTEFSGLTMALMQGGVGIDQAMGLVKKGIEGSLEAADELAKIRDRMPNGLLKDRFTRQLQKELPEDIFALVKDTKLLHKTLNDQAAAKAFARTVGGQGIASFNQMTDTLQSATSEVRAFLENLLDLGKTTIGQVGKMLGFDEMLKGVRDTLKDFNKDLKDFVASDRFKNWLESVRPIVIPLGKAILTVGTALGALAGGFTTIFGAWKVSGKALALLTTPVTALATKFPKIGKALAHMLTPFKFLGKIAGKLVGTLAGGHGLLAAFSGISTAVLDMGAVLGDPNATGWEKFEAITRGALKGIGKFVDTMFFGLPGQIAHHFFPDLNKTFNGGISALFEEMKTWFPAKGKGVLKTIGKWVEDLGSYLLKELPGIGEKVGEAFGQVTGGITKFIIDAFADGVSDGGDEFNIGMTKIVAGGLGFGFKFIRGFFKGAGEAFGTSEAGLGTRLHIFWQSALLEMKDEVGEFGESVERALANPWQRGFNAISDLVFGRITGMLKVLSFLDPRIAAALVGVEAIHRQSKEVGKLMESDEAAAAEKRAASGREARRVERQEKLGALKNELRDQDAATAAWQKGETERRRQVRANELRGFQTSLGLTKERTDLIGKAGAAAFASARGETKGVTSAPTKRPVFDKITPGTIEQEPLRAPVRGLGRMDDASVAARKKLRGDQWAADRWREHDAREALDQAKANKMASARRAAMTDQEAAWEEEQQSWAALAKTSADSRAQVSAAQVSARARDSSNPATTAPGAEAREQATPVKVEVKVTGNGDPIVNALTNKMTTRVQQMTGKE